MTTESQTEPVTPLSSTVMDLDVEVSRPSTTEVASQSQTTSQSTMEVSADISQADPKATMDVSVDILQVNSDADANPSQSTMDVSIDVGRSQSNAKDTVPAPTSSDAPMDIEDDMMDQDGDHSGRSSLPLPSATEDDRERLSLANGDMGQSALDDSSPDSVARGPRRRKSERNRKAESTISSNPSSNLKKRKEMSESDEGDEDEGGIPFAVSLAKTINSQGNGIRDSARNHKLAANRYETVMLQYCQYSFSILNLTRN